MCCKALAFAANPNLGNIQFPTLLGHPAVRLPAQTVPLGDTLLRNHRTRNQMQQGNAAFTVDDQHCADAILDAVAAMEHCFPGAVAVLPDALEVALRLSAWSGFILRRAMSGCVAHSRMPCAHMAGTELAAEER
jgi:hypothetical protein